MTLKGTTIKPYRKTNEVENTSFIKITSITGMDVYRDKSLEELRLEDYLNGCREKKSNLPKIATDADDLSGKSMDDLEVMEAWYKAKLDKISKEKERKIHNQLEKLACVVCKTESKTVMLMNCKHLCVCKTCSTKVNACPLCREDIRDRVDVYF